MVSEGNYYLNQRKRVNIDSKMQILQLWALLHFRRFEKSFSYWNLFTLEILWGVTMYKQQEKM